MAAERLLAFVERHFAGVARFEDVRTEQLAEAFREEFGLGPFPRLDELRAAVARAGIALDWLPPHAPEGLNTWSDEQGPVIHLRRGLSRLRAETTLAHELREAIENAASRVYPDYQGQRTHQNRKMNPESDQFGAFLLMQASATRHLLTLEGFDFAAFASGHRRSPASVVAYAQTLFPKTYSGAAPCAGLWLYEPPWNPQGGPAVDASDFRVTQQAHLMGFSTSRSSQRAASLAAIFPNRGASAEAAETVRAALATHKRVTRLIGGIDLFGDDDFTVVAEPLFVQGQVQRALLTAVRADSINLVDPWLRRIATPVDGTRYQHI